MKTIFTLFFAFTLGFAFAQTTEYSTGQTYGDAWTGWSTPIETGTTASSVNGADIYTFSGLNSTAYTVELYRQFTINSNDLDIYLNATAANTVVSVEFSTDNVSYTEIGNATYGVAFVQQGIVIPTHDPVTSTFYIKIKATGTFGSPSQLQLNNFKIDAVLNTGSTVSISPTADQNILTGANGSALTASEAPSAADSREWKYSTTSGSGYGSFSPVETGTSYTPNFAAAGTYYVICESTFGGDVESSNEVQINVTAPSGLVEFNDSYKFLKTQDRVDIITADQNYTVRVYGLSGQLISTDKGITTYDFSSLHKGLYFLSVETEQGVRQTIKFVHR
jgi:hypothetical protein